MGRLFTLILIALAAISGFTMYKLQDVGFLNIGLGDYTFETTLLIAGSFFLVGLFLLMLLYKVFALIHNIFLYFGAQRKARLLDKARISLSQGLIELAEGRFKEAEKLLLKQVKHSDNVLLTYLSAARAAQHQGAHERRDDYLRKAHESTPTAEVAIGLTKAELQIDHEQYEQALANLTHLYEISHNHAYVIKLLLKTYRRLSDWKNIQFLLKDAKNLKLLSEDKIFRLELESWHGLLTEQAHHKDIHALAKIWEQIPAKLKTQAPLIEHYALLLIELDAADQAEQVLRQYLNSYWTESTIVLYSELDVAIDHHQLEQVEQWLKDHQHNAYLLLALGKICLNSKLWGKAQHYLEASLATQPVPETYLKLAQLLENQMNETSQAQKYYQMGLECLSGEHHHVYDTTIDELQTTEPTPALKIVHSDVT